MLTEGMKKSILARVKDKTLILYKDGNFRIRCFNNTAYHCFKCGLTNLCKSIDGDKIVIETKEFLLNELPEEFL